jgi:hypothetical protein
VHFGSIRFFSVAAIEELLLRLFTFGCFTFFLITPHLMTNRLRVLLSVMDTNKRKSEECYHYEEEGRGKKGGKREPKQEKRMMSVVKSVSYDTKVFITTKHPAKGLRFNSILTSSF